MLYFLVIPVSGQWVQLADFQTASVRSFAVSDSKLFAFIEFQGIYVSTDNGTTWVSRNSGLSVSNITKIILLGDTLFAFGAGALCKMNVNDTSWINVITPDGTRSFIAEGSTYLFSSPSPDIYRSTDYGFTWNQVTLPGSPIVQGLGKNGTTFFAGSGSGIRRSTDDGEKWEWVYTSQVLVNTFYSHSSGLFANPFVAQVIRSTDNGSNWVTVNNGLSAANVITSFSSSGTTIFAGSTDNGVYATTDPSNGWVDINTGLTPSTVFALEAADDNLFAGTYQAGIWKRPLSEIVSVEQNNTGSLLNSFELFQNYPNPFNPETTIEFSLLQSEFVRLTITNILGEEIETLVSEELSAGNNKTKWNAVNYPSGVYIAHLRAGSFSQSRKIVLQK
jgi:hypothetical protein